jgi:opacity protein-like surface antigen
LLLGLLTSVAAHAEDTSQWQFNVTPYVWFGGVHSTFSRTVVPGRPPLEGQSDVGSLLPYAEHLPAMIAGEVHYGRFGLGIDLTLIDANFGFSQRTPPALSGNADTDNGQVTIITSYRAVETEQQQIDIGVGARIWSVHSTLTLGRLSTESTTKWADALVALSYHIDLPANFGLTFYGDIGGIGSKLTYQLMGTVDYAPTNWLTLRAGYRDLFFDYRSSTLTRSATLHGPIIAATFRF